MRGPIAGEVERELRDWDDVLISPELQSNPRGEQAEKQRRGDWRDGFTPLFFLALFAQPWRPLRLTFVRVRLVTMAALSPAESLPRRRCWSDIFPYSKPSSRKSSRPPRMLSSIHPRKDIPLNRPPHIRESTRPTYSPRSAASSKACPLRNNRGKSSLDRRCACALPSRRRCESCARSCGWSCPARSSRQSALRDGPEAASGLDSA